MIRFLIITTTEGPEEFATMEVPGGFASVAAMALPHGWRIYHEATFASKQEAQDWLSSELASWDSLS